MLTGWWSSTLRMVLQVQRLGAGDAPTIQRELYMRNVSSHSLDALESPEQDPLPEPSRVAGDIIRFHRQGLPGYLHGFSTMICLHLQLTTLLQ